MRMLRIISNIILSIWCWFTILLLIGLLISYKADNKWILDNIYPIYEKTAIVIFLIVTFSTTANVIEKMKISHKKSNLKRLLFNIRNQVYLVYT